MSREVKNNKKKNSSAPEKKARTRQSSSELNDYGLEPPKIYNNSGKASQALKSAREKRKNTSSAPKTIQEKRKEENKRRKQKKILRKIILWAVLIVGIAAVIVILSLTVFFKIQTITIKGNSVYTAQEISAVLPIEKDKNLFLTDTSSAEEKLETNLPYIYDAQISRKLPSTIIVNIKETEKIYAIKNKDKTYTLLDDNFKVLEIGAAKRPKKSVLIKKAALNTATAGNTAEFTNKKTKENLQKIIAAAKKLKLNKITEIYSVDINNNYIVHDGRITIKLGSAENLEDKLYSAFAAIEKIEEQNPQSEGELTVGSGKQIYFTEK